MAIKGKLHYNRLLRRYTEGYIRSVIRYLCQESLYCNQCVLGAEAALSCFCVRNFLSCILFQIGDNGIFEIKLVTKKSPNIELIDLN